MELLWIALSGIAVIAILVLITAYICFRMAFYVPERNKKNDNEFSTPPGKEYDPYRDIMISWMKEVREIPYKKVSVTSFDGLTLRGKYYEYAPDAPIELLMHGYRGSAERDLCGGVQRCFSLGRNALIVDQRACGKSDGNVITFGVNESKDCLKWIDFVINHFGNDVKIIIGGISMGASTVLMAAGGPLPKNVIGVLADCGYTSARDIIMKTICEMHLPPNFMYPFVRLAALIYGHFNIDETAPIEAVKKCRLPVIFLHGEQDDFVPCEMSQRNYEACASVKKIVTFPGAAHGLSYVVDPDTYLNSLVKFAPLMGIETKRVDYKNNSK